MNRIRNCISLAICGLLVNLIYGLVLPFFARLPLTTGRKLATQLGRIYSRLGLDWRTVWQQENDVSGRTRLAQRLMRPELSTWRVDVLVKQRFRHAALEDLEGHWLALRRNAPLQSRIDGLDAINEALRHRKGIVLLTMHFDASILGIAMLGQAGLKLNPMAFDVHEDTNIPFSVRRYFRRKYSGLNTYLNGGRVCFIQRDLAHCYRAVRAGEGVVILGDAPTSNTKIAIPIDFFGRRLGFAPGFLRLAENTGAPVVAFVCLRDSRGGYHIKLSPVFWPVNGKHQDNVSHLYAFLEVYARRFPGRWWAADILTHFLSMKAADDDETNTN
jgi:lauroyl/myristoyl acyltransferase